MKYSYEELAGMIDHALLHPTLGDLGVAEGCRMAEEYRIASVCVKPCAVAQAAELLRESPVRVGCVVGFPHGNSSIVVKRFETEQACRDGAEEIDMVVNVGKALDGDWHYVETEVREVTDVAHAGGAKVKVIFETDYLPEDETKKRLCEVASKAKADWVKTSTGFGFVKGDDGHLISRGATEHDLRLMRASCPPSVQVKASGGVRTLDALIRVRDLGCTRCGTSATREILDEYRRRSDGGASAKSGVEDAGGY